MAGAFFIRKGGAFGLSASGGEFLLQSPTGCEECCPVCEAYDPNPPSFLEEFNPLDSAWTVGDYLTYTPMIVTYPGNVHVESHATEPPVAGENWGVQFNRTIKKSSAQVDLVRGGFRLVTRDAGLAANSKRRVTILFSAYDRDLDNPIFESNLTFFNDPSGPDSNSFQNFRPELFTGSTFNNLIFSGTDWELVWRRVSTTHWRQELWYNGALKHAGPDRTLASKPYMLEEDFCCELILYFVIYHVNYVVDGHMYTEVDDVFLEIVSS